METVVVEKQPTHQPDYSPCLKSLSRKLLGTSNFPTDLPVSAWATIEKLRPIFSRYNYNTSRNFVNSLKNLMRSLGQNESAYSNELDELYSASRVANYLKKKENHFSDTHPTVEDAICVARAAFEEKVDEKDFISVRNKAIVLLHTYCLMAPFEWSPISVSILHKVSYGEKRAVDSVLGHYDNKKGILYISGKAGSESLVVVPQVIRDCLLTLMSHAKFDRKKEQLLFSVDKQSINKVLSDYAKSINGKTLTVSKIERLYHLMHKVPTSEVSPPPKVASVSKKRKRVVDNEHHHDAHVCKKSK